MVLHNRTTWLHIKLRFPKYIFILYFWTDLNPELTKYALRDLFSGCGLHEQRETPVIRQATCLLAVLKITGPVMDTTNRQEYAMFWHSLQEALFSVFVLS
jgi:hypothetical protein